MGSRRLGLGRRSFVRHAGVSSVGAVLGGCNGDSDPQPGGGGESAAAGGDGWAEGGTDQIRVGYPEDGVFAAAGTCDVALSEATTRGPCYFADDTGEDISEGSTGLPMQLCLRVVDADCNPVEGARVEVWHCDVNGAYSGDTRQSRDSSGFAVGFCTGGDSAAASSTWYRGQLTTGANGRVNFKSCFPGWYPGRTLHIHFAVSGGSGTRVVSQLCFPDELATEVFTTHPSYLSRGEQDTPLAGGRDAVFPSDFTPYLLTTERNTDGTLLAYHSIQIF